MGASFRDWINSLAKEDDQGRPKYTLAAIKEIAGSPDDDTNVSTVKRIAARLIVDMAEGSTVAAREALDLILNRTEGRPPQTAIIHASLSADPSLELTEETLERIRGAGAGVIADGQNESCGGL